MFYGTPVKNPSNGPFSVHKTRASQCAYMGDPLGALSLVALLKKNSRNDQRWLQST